MSSPASHDLVSGSPQTQIALVHKKARTSFRVESSSARRLITADLSLSHVYVLCVYRARVLCRGAEIALVIICQLSDIMTVLKKSKNVILLRHGALVMVLHVRTFEKR